MPARLLTYSDLASMPDDGLRRELLDGELFVSPSPVTRHQRLVRRILVALDVHIQAHGGGEVFVAPFDVLLSDSNVVEPDVLVVADDQSHILTDKNVQGAPALVVEVLSNPRLDRVLKRDVYARFGVPEYWIVDPGTDRIEVYHQGKGGYSEPKILAPGDVITFAPLPGFSLDLTTLFAR